jgi:outer membrane protein TolC
MRVTPVIARAAYPGPLAVLPPVHRLCTARRTPLYAFDQALLNALQDVETAFTAVRAAQDRTVRLGEAVESAERASQLAKALYEAGEADFLSVLDAHRELLDT